MEHLLFGSKCSLFLNIFKYMIFQRCQGALLWSKRLTDSEKLLNPSYKLNTSGGTAFTFTGWGEQVQEIKSLTHKYFSKTSINRYSKK